MDHPLNKQALHQQLDQLALKCDAVKTWLDKVGKPEPRTRERGFKTLAQAICGQQISVHAARAIWERLEAAAGPTCTAHSVAALGYDRLREVGLSHRKAEYTLGLAEAMISGALNTDILPSMDDETAISELVKLRGFGPWSAQIYLLFAEGRSDIWPHDDLALQEGLKIIFDLSERPTGKATIPLIEHWRPYRGTGALFVWHVYGSSTL